MHAAAIALVLQEIMTVPQLIACVIIRDKKKKKICTIVCCADQYIYCRSNLAWILFLAMYL